MKEENLMNIFYKISFGLGMGTINRVMAANTH
jgi:hypothetical protein